MKKLFLTVAHIVVALSSAQETHDSGGLTINTQQGAVVGTQVLPTVRQFLGIPYAIAQRWQTPKLPSLRIDVLDASAFGHGCFQMLSPTNAEYLTLNGNGGLDVPTSEDCLVANIWSPSVDRVQKTAVLVWIHGGSLTCGTSGVPVFNGTNMVRDNDDITLVTLNYRLNIFGQPNAPQLEANSTNLNFGLLDIEAAIEWVHANIANFGGDPDRITLFGQSAGAAAVDAYAFSHPQDTIVKGIIEQSGGLAGNTDSFVIAPGNHDNWNTISAAVGCGNDLTPEQFICMQNIPARTLEDSVINTLTQFFLVVDNRTIFADIDARAANGNFLHVPLLAGSNANEVDIFIVGEQLVRANDTIPVLTEILSDAMTPISITCPVSMTASQRLNENVPIFRYQYEGVFRSLSTRPDLRAYHSAEIPMVFGTYNNTVINGRSFPASEDQIALSKYMQSAWVAFARNPTEGLPELGWPLYTGVQTRTTAFLGSYWNTSGIVLDTAINWCDPYFSKPLAAVAAEIGPLLSGMKF